MKKAPNQILIILLCVFIAEFVLFRTGAVSLQFLYASFYGGLLNVLNTAASLKAFDYSVEKGGKIFILFTLGGMLFRIMLILAAILILLKFLNIDKYGFIFTFSVLYILFLAVEVNYFRLKISQLKASRLEVSQKKA